MYQIQITYQTGDSFRMEEKTSYLDYSWTDMEAVVEAVGYIKEHYRELYREFKKRPWFRESKDNDMFQTLHSLILPKDKGSDPPTFVQSAFWCGYFERLLSIEIKVDIGMKEEFY